MTATRFLPFARLLASVRRPDGVLLRFKKPCFFILFFSVYFHSYQYTALRTQTQHLFIQKRGHYRGTCGFFRAANHHRLGFIVHYTEGYAVIQYH